MRKLVSILSISLLFALSSCSVYEDIYFLEDGGVKYQMSIDGSSILSIAPDMSSGINASFPSDSIIYFSQLIKDSLKSVSITPEMEKELNNIASLYLKIDNDIDNKKFSISINGDFDNILAFNNAFASMVNLKAMMNNAKALATENQIPIESFYEQTGLDWDGKLMKRVLIPVKTGGRSEENESDMGDLAMKMDGSLNELFTQGKMVVKYHFPKTVKEISNPNATLSQDGKTVIIEYSGSAFIKPSNDFAIEIVTE